MNSFDQIKESLKPELAELNALIHDSLHTSNQMMNAIVDNYLESKGKQIRPILVIMSAKLLGECNRRTIASAAAIETLHNATLIHDDVVDETRQRRGNLTVNARWDNHIAVLVGDFFVSTSLQMALLTGDKECIDIIADLGRTLSLGEIDQIDRARAHTLNEESYFNIIGSKTASLFEACVRMGGLSVDATPDQISRITEFARLLGLCFQIRDDIFDYFEDSTTGKPSGNDLREGKVTLPLLYALRHSDPEESKAMESLLHNDMLESDDIALLLRFARENGGIDHAYRRMEELRDKGAEILSSFPHSATREEFTDLFDFIIERTF